MMSLNNCLNYAAMCSKIMHLIAEGSAKRFLRIVRSQSLSKDSKLTTLFSKKQLTASAGSTPKTISK